MEIPDKLQLGGFEIKVHKEKTENGKLYGQFDSIKQQVNLFNVEGNIPEHQQAATLMHELIEGIDALNGLELKHHQITILSNCLFSIIRQSGLDFRKPKETIIKKSFKEDNLSREEAAKAIKTVKEFRNDNG